MKDIIIREFASLSDAMYFLETTLYDRAESGGKKGLDAEIKYINQSWRVGITQTDEQGDFFSGASYDAI